MCRFVASFCNAIMGFFHSCLFFVSRSHIETTCQGVKQWTTLPSLFGFREKDVFQQNTSHELIRTIVSPFVLFLFLQVFLLLSLSLSLSLFLREHHSHELFHSLFLFLSQTLPLFLKSLTTQKTPEGPSMPTSHTKQVHNFWIIFSFFLHLCTGRCVLSFWGACNSF